MTVHVVCSIRDAAANMFSPPFLAPAKGAAMRMFGDAVLKEGNQMGQHPEHFELFCVALFDDSDCSFVLEKSPISWALAVDYVPKGGSHAS